MYEESMYEMSCAWREFWCLTATSAVQMSQQWTLKQGSSDGKSRLPRLWFLKFRLPFTTTAQKYYLGGARSKPCVSFKLSTVLDCMRTQCADHHPTLHENGPSVQYTHTVAITQSLVAIMVTRAGLLVPRCSCERTHFTTLTSYTSLTSSV